MSKNSNNEEYKCPSCGHTLSSFMLNCPACGTELGRKDGTSSVKEFVKKLNEIENGRNTSVSFKASLTNVLNNENISKKKASLISSFVIPNNKEDLIDFLILASSNMMDKSIFDYSPEETDAWSKKFEQAYQKASICYGDSSEFDRIKKLYDEKIKKNKKQKKKNVIIITSLILGIIIFILTLVYGITLAPDRREEKQLEETVCEIYSYMEKGNYDMARTKAATLQFGGSSYDKKIKWEKIQKELIEQIDISQAKKK